MTSYVVNNVVLFINFFALYLNSITILTQHIENVENIDIYSGVCRICQDLVNLSKNSVENFRKDCLKYRYIGHKYVVGSRGLEPRTTRL